MLRSLVGSEMCIRDSNNNNVPDTTLDVVAVGMMEETMTVDVVHRSTTLILVFVHVNVVSLRLLDATYAELLSVTWYKPDVVMVVPPGEDDRVVEEGFKTVEEEGREEIEDGEEVVEEGDVDEDDGVDGVDEEGGVLTVESTGVVECESSPLPLPPSPPPSPPPLPPS